MNYKYINKVKGNSDHKLEQLFLYFNDAVARKLWLGKGVGKSKSKRQSKGDMLDTRELLANLCQARELDVDITIHRVNAFRNDSEEITFYGFGPAFAYLNLSQIQAEIKHKWHKDLAKPIPKSDDQKQLEDYILVWLIARVNPDRVPQGRRVMEKKLVNQALQRILHLHKEWHSIYKNRNKQWPPVYLLEKAGVDSGEESELYGRGRRVIMAESIEACAKFLIGIDDEKHKLAGERLKGLM